MHRLPHRVRDVVGTRDGGVGGFGEGPRYLLGGEGAIVLVAFETEEQGGGKLGREEIVKKRLCYLAWVRGPRQVREPLWLVAKHKSFGSLEGVWSGRRPEVRPVSSVGRGDGFEIRPPRALHIAPVEGGRVETGYPCKLVIFPP